MENTPHEEYEYARKRIKQKKNLYFHFVLLLIGGLSIFVANVLFKIGQPYLWYIWIISVWAFFFILHFIKVYITDRFMNKKWEREQIDKLVHKQQKKLSQFQSELDSKK